MDKYLVRSNESRNPRSFTEKWFDRSASSSGCVDVSCVHLMPALWQEHIVSRHLTSSSPAFHSLLGFIGDWGSCSSKSNRFLSLTGRVVEVVAIADDHLSPTS